MDDPSPCPSRLLASRHRTKSWHFYLSGQEQEPSGLLRLILLAFLSQQRRNAVTQQLMMWMMSFVFEFSKLSHRKEIILMTSFIQFRLAHFRETNRRFVCFAIVYNSLLSVSASRFRSIRFEKWREPRTCELPRGASGTTSTQRAGESSGVSCIVREVFVRVRYLSFASAYCTVL